MRFLTGLLYEAKTIKGVETCPLGTRTCAATPGQATMFRRARGRARAPPRTTPRAGRAAGGAAPPSAVRSGLGRRAGAVLPPPSSPGRRPERPRRGGRPSSARRASQRARPRRPPGWRRARASVPRSTAVEDQRGPLGEAPRPCVGVRVRRRHRLEHACGQLDLRPEERVRVARVVDAGLVGADERDPAVVPARGVDPVGRKEVGVLERRQVPGARARRAPPAAAPPRDPRRTGSRAGSASEPVRRASCSAARARPARARRRAPRPPRARWPSGRTPSRDSASSRAGGRAARDVGAGQAEPAEPHAGEVDRADGAAGVERVVDGQAAPLVAPLVRELEAGAHGSHDDPDGARGPRHELEHGLVRRRVGLGRDGDERIVGARVTRGQVRRARGLDLVRARRETGDTNPDGRSSGPAGTSGSQAPSSAATSKAPSSSS